MTEPKPDQETLDLYAGCASLLMLPLGPIARGFALSVLWRQNAVPHGGTEIAPWEAVGILCLIAALRLSLTVRLSEPKPITLIAGHQLAEFMGLAELVAISTWAVS